MGERFLSPRQLKEELGIGYHLSHLGRLEKAGLFPRRRALGGGGRVGWLASEVDAYLATLPLAGDTYHPPVQRDRKVVAINDEPPPGMLRCEACGGLFKRKAGRPPRRCPECRGAGG